MIQEAELPHIPGSAYRRDYWAFNGVAEDGKLTLWVSDPSKIRKTQVFDVTLTHKGWVTDDGALQALRVKPE